MKKIEIFKTDDGQFFEDESEAMEHENTVRRTNNFKQRYAFCYLYGELSDGRVEDDQLIQWARENRRAFQALCSLVLGEDE